MKKVLLVYPPFCTPASPPYSITNLHSFLKKNRQDCEVLDLNLEFHKMKFPEHHDYFRSISKWENYKETAREFLKKTAECYAENNRKVVHDSKPELFLEMLDIIKSKNPDIVAFSIVYSSQAFFANALLKELNNLKTIKTIIGGPAVNTKLINLSSFFLKDEIELLKYLHPKKKDIDYDYHLDFSIYDLSQYFTPSAVIPLKTSSTCYYKKCTFCTHFSRTTYLEYPLDKIKKEIIASKQKHFFLIDDTIPKKRILQLAEVFKKEKAIWSCQLKPIKYFDFKTMETLFKSGLKMIIWGIESGNERILNLMKKGTNPKDVKAVLEASHKAGIKNCVFAMFGFPTETREEFMDTIGFLKENSDNIDLSSTSIFGLQKGSKIFDFPKEFGITKITEEKRTVLEPKINYETNSGLSQEEARRLRMKHHKTIDKLNKYPKPMNFFREHMLCQISVNTDAAN